MGEHSKIEWTDHTFNPWWGCTKVSPGCKNCYADTLAHRWGVNVWGPLAPRRAMSESYWRQPVAWNRRAAETGVRARVFCASMADVFEGPETCQLPEAYAVVQTARKRLWDLIEATPHLDWLLLTKRPQHIETMIPDRWRYPGPPPEYGVQWPRNAFLGISAENQEQFNARWPVLECFGRRSYVPVLFVSLEPLVGPIDMDGWLEETHETEEDNIIWTRGIDWVIAGGESGSGARAVHPGWIRSIRDQCSEYEVPFLFKQWGSHTPVADGEAPRRGDLWVICDGTRERGYAVHCQPWKHGDVGAAAGRWSPWADAVMRPMDKSVAGRDLDGRTWDQFPFTTEGVSTAQEGR